MYRFFVSISFYFFRLNAQECNCWVMWSVHYLFWKELLNFPEWLYDFTFPPAYLSGPIYIYFFIVTILFCTDLTPKQSQTFESRWRVYLKHTTQQIVFQFKINFVFQYDYLGSESMIVTNKIIEIIGLVNAVSIFLFILVRKIHTSFEIIIGN